MNNSSFAALILDERRKGIFRRRLGMAKCCRSLPLVLSTARFSVPSGNGLSRLVEDDDDDDDDRDVAFRRGMAAKAGITVVPGVGL